MAKMRAMVLSELGPIEGRPLRMEEVERHEIRRPDEVLIRIEACGVCHSQLHSIEGDWKESLGIPPSLPVVPGHEVVGEVVEAGSAVRGLAVGDRAGVSPLLDSCGGCAYCEAGSEQLCESSEILGETMRGGYAEYVTAPERFATRVPRGMDPRYAAPLFCAGVTAYKAVKAAEPSPGRRVGIFGIGGVGHMAVQFARIEGLEVTAVSRNRRHLDLASRLGAARAVEYAGPEGTLRALGAAGGPLDAAIVLAPSDEVTETALRAVKRGGTVVMATVGEVRGFVAFEEKTVRGTLIGSRADMAEVVRLAAKHRLSVVYEERPLSEANEALEALKHSRVEARTVLVP